ncbi:gamma-secretase subunit Aph-1b-like [Clavelina lepadiformis]|uniref:gamma-secretase subunit Aph-1b-like n=1 Tax=Clavelina lepadiformis TaxID=159417 RepID=UPI004042CE08
MPLMVFFGCMFVAFGPSLALFVFTVMKFPLRIILLVVGAFFWLLSLLFSALLWLAVVPLREELAFSLVFSVIFQELMRFALFKLMNKAETGLEDALSEEERRSIASHKLSYVSGFGFGLMSGLFSVINVLSNSIGPGNVGITGASPNFFLVSSFLASSFILLNTFWNVIIFNAYKKRKLAPIAIVILMHMLVSCLTLLNTLPHSIYVSLIVSYVSLILVMGWAFKIAGGSLGNLKASFVCK